MTGAAVYTDRNGIRCEVTRREPRPPKGYRVSVRVNVDHYVPKYRFRARCAIIHGGNVVAKAAGHAVTYDGARAKAEYRAMVEWRKRGYAVTPLPRAPVAQEGAGLCA